MNSLKDLQNKFINSLYDETAFSGFLSNDEYCENMNIYHNNLYFGLYENLNAKFPISVLLLGEYYFKQAAFEFIKSNPLNMGENNSFGEYLPRFLQNKLSKTEYGFVAKIAHIEWAKFCAEIAPNVTNLDFAQIGQLLAENNDAILLHPSFSLINTSFNAVEIYFAQMNDNLGSVQIRKESNKIAVWRDGNFDPCFKPLSQFQIKIIVQMQRGKSILFALEDALSNFENPEDLHHEFIELCDLGIFTTNNQKEN